MTAVNICTVFFLLLATIACGTTSMNFNRPSTQPVVSEAFQSVPEVKEGELAGADGQFLTTVSQNGVSVRMVISKPSTTLADVVLAFHGTVETDDKVVEAARKTLEESKKMTSRRDVMFISVAYPEENLLMGDNLKDAEAALLWVKERASLALKVKIKRIFLLGHSQGGYLVTRLNTMHGTDGVIANAPGPLDLKLR